MIVVVYACLNVLATSVCERIEIARIAPPTNEVVCESNAAFHVWQWLKGLPGYRVLAFGCERREWA